MMLQENSSPKLVIIGLGMIGGSLAAAIKQRKQDWEVIALVRNRDTAEYALINNLIDRAIFSLDEVAGVLGENDMVVLAVPPMAFGNVIADMQQKIPACVTVTDVASVKQHIVDEFISVYGEWPSQFIPGHPIAGSENSGVQAANPNLYRNHRVILTPQNSENDGLDASHYDHHFIKVRDLWLAVEAEVLTLSVEEHDRILAATSHLPHAIAYVLVDALTSQLDQSEILRYAAGGFRDFTRIASSDPQMWTDIFYANRTQVLQSIDAFQEHLHQLREAISQGNRSRMSKIVNRAKLARDQFVSLSDLSKRRQSDPINEY